MTCCIDELLDINIKDDLKYCLHSIEYIAIKQQNIIQSSNDELKGFIESQYISPALYPLFMSMLDIGTICGKHVALNYRKSNKKLEFLLSLHGVLAYYKNLPASREIINKLPYTDIKLNDTTGRVVDKINSLLPVNMTDTYRHRFTSKLYELIDNYQKHSNSLIPAKANAYRDKGHFFISLYDAGVGIPANVRSYMRDENMSDVDALKWALVDGHSAAENSKIVSRGAGLGIIESFVKENHGVLFLASGNAVYRIRDKRRNFDTMKAPIVGTFVSIRINVDKKHIYSIPEEVHS